jgi:5-methyltetrahydropteroyltriglutamate--homocysteine methyltransferase
MDLAGERKHYGKASLSFGTGRGLQLGKSAQCIGGGESPKIHDRAVKERLLSVTREMARRQSDFPAYRAALRARLALVAYPTTTIGSLPQTEEIRKAGAAHANASLSCADYNAFLRKETAAAVRWQEEIGIDVLVHGEFERNHMVQYLGEQLAGYAFTKHGWVQSYGSHYVRPRIIFGDVSRPKPMTVEWSAYAQPLTKKPIKRMLTGPVTMLQWSFVRDNLPRADVCRQITLALPRTCAIPTTAVGSPRMEPISTTATVIMFRTTL